MIKRTTSATLIAILLLFSVVYAANETQFGVTGNGGTNWSNAGTIKTSDDQRASYNTTTQDWIGVEDMGFVAVVGTVDSIRVNIEGYGVIGGSERRTMDAQLIIGGIATGDIVSFAFTGTGTGAESTIFAVGSTDVLWNTAADSADVTASNFGAQIRDNDAIAHNLNVDAISIVVHYTGASGVTSHIMRTVTRSEFE